MSEILSSAGPVVLALMTTVLIDQIMARRGLSPPAFLPGKADMERLLPLVRRSLAAILLFGVLWVGVFSPLGALGRGGDIDPGSIATPQLFMLHVVLLLVAGCWYLLGFGFEGSGRIVDQFGLRVSRVWREIAIGLGAGVAAWVLVIVIMVVAGLGMWSFGGRNFLPESAPPLVPWLAGLPLLLRLGLSLSAGVAEEIFFRGFLQPRVGIALSTALFVLAHLSYEQPFMLLGVLVLSLIFSFLVLWRQNVWAAVTAHATFDAIQLALMIPWALENLEGGELPGLAAAGLLGAL